MCRNEMKVSDILIRWILAQQKFRIHQIESEVPGWAFLMYGVMHTPGTFSREFRRMKNGGLKFKDKDLCFMLVETGTLKKRHYELFRYFERERETENAVL